MSKGGKKSTVAGEKITTTVRLPVSLSSRVRELCHLRRMSQTALFETAIEEFLERNEVSGSYQLVLKEDHVVFLQVSESSTTVLAVQQLNGVPLEVLRERFSERVKGPVDLITDLIDEGAEYEHLA